MIVSKVKLVTLLRQVADLIDADDSFEGSLTYAWPDDESQWGTGVFEVECGVRTGNSMGQGGMIYLPPTRLDEP